MGKSSALLFWREARGGKWQRVATLNRCGGTARQSSPPRVCGFRLRVAAARALIGRPEVVIADEPTSALDAPLRDSFMDLLLGECRAAGSTLVFVSHDERLASRFDARLSLAAINRASSDDPANAATSEPGP